MTLKWPQFRRECAAVWERAWRRSLNSGDDHGWAANAADEAVRRFLTKRKRREGQEG